MSNKEKFKRFCVAWVTYLVGTFALLRWVLVLQFGEIPVVVGVVLGLLAWVIGFFKWVQYLATGISPTGNEAIYIFG